MSQEIIAAAIGAAAGATTVLGAVAGVFRYAIRAELSVFELSLMKRLNGTYVHPEALEAIKAKLDYIEEHGCPFRANHRRSD